jgi:ubiquinone/menaquinone biosynthesis C-methylase UbiE
MRKEAVMSEIAGLLTRGSFDEAGLYFAPQAVLFTAFKLGVFEAIGAEGSDIEEVAAVTSCSAKGTRMLLDCMTAMGFLEKRSGRYRLNEISREYCLSSSENCLRAFFACSERLAQLWFTLPEAVATGRRTSVRFSKKEQQRLNVDIAQALFHVHKKSAWKLAALCKEIFSLDGRQIKILDVAAGSAVWSIPFILQSENAKATAVDFREVVRVARGFAEKFAVGPRYRFLGGDIRTVEFGSDEYDIVLLGHICHSEGAEWSRRLIAKAFAALQRSGRLLIMDYFPDENRCSTELPLSMALNALLGSDEGDTFTLSEYRQWLSAAGFAEVRSIELDDRTPVIMAKKA